MNSIIWAAAAHSEIVFALVSGFIIWFGYFLGSRGKAAAVADVKQKLGATEQKLRATEQKLGATEQRLDDTEQRLDDTEQRLDDTMRALEGEKAKSQGLAKALCKARKRTEEERAARESAEGRARAAEDHSKAVVRMAAETAAATDRVLLRLRSSVDRIAEVVDAPVVVRLLKKARLSGKVGGLATQGAIIGCAHVKAAAVLGSSIKAAATIAQPWVALVTLALGTASTVVSKVSAEVRRRHIVGELLAIYAAFEIEAPKLAGPKAPLGLDDLMTVGSEAVHVTKLFDPTFEPVSDLIELIAS